MIDLWIIIIFLSVILFTIYWLLLRPIVIKLRLKLFLEVKDMFENEVELLTTRYLATKVVHDILAGDTAISVNEYNTIILDGCSFVLSNITKYFKKTLFIFFNKVEIQELVIHRMNTKLDAEYTLSFLEPIEEFERNRGE